MVTVTVVWVRHPHVCQRVCTLGGSGDFISSHIASDTI